MYKHFENKKVLITGNTGFKGSWLTLWMLKMNARVFGISDRIPTNPSLFEVLDLENKIQHQFIDIRDLQKIKTAIAEIRPDFIFHLAAQPIVSVSYADPITTLHTNTMGTAHILEATRALENECVVVMITSDKAYENHEQVWGYREVDQLGGKDIYSCSKGAAELIIYAFYHSFFAQEKPNIRLVSARAGNVIGGGDFAKDRIVPDCMRAWSQNEKVTIRNPMSTRPWQHVMEPLHGYITLAAHLKQNDSLNGQSFNFGPRAEQNQTVLDLIDKLSKYYNFESKDHAYEYVKAKRFYEAHLLKLNCDKALHYLNWQANLNYLQTVKFVGEWYARFYAQNENMFDFTLSQIAEYEKVAQEF